MWFMKQLILLIRQQPHVGKHQGEQVQLCIKNFNASQSSAVNTSVKWQTCNTLAMSYYDVDAWWHSWATHCDCLRTLHPPPLPISCWGSASHNPHYGGDTHPSQQVSLTTDCLPIGQCLHKHHHNSVILPITKLAGGLSTLVPTLDRIYTHTYCLAPHTVWQGW